MKKILLLLSCALLHSAASAADCQQFPKDPAEMEPVQWQPGFNCHKENAAAGDAASQLWLGRAYLLGVGDKLSATNAAIWFNKAAEQGNENAAFELADLIYYKQIPRGSYKTPFELYRQGIDISEVRLRTEFKNTTPRTRLVEMLMKGDGAEKNWQLAQSYSTDIRQTDFRRIMGRTKIKLNTEPEEAKQQMRVTSSMSKNEAIDTLLCKQPVDDHVNLFAVFAAVEEYGVPIEQAIMRPCASDSKGRIPLIYTLEQKRLDESTTYAWPRQLSIYLVLTRGDYQAFEAVLKKPLKSGRTVSGEINYMIDTTVADIKAGETKFRKLYAESQPELRKQIQFGYSGIGNEQLWMSFIPLHVVNPVTKDFGNCVSYDINYKNIDDLPGYRDYLLNKLGGLAGGTAAGLVTACLNEPDYKAKMLTMKPYVLLVGEYNSAKSDRMHTGGCAD
ncbi:hypothetical protein GTP45_09975 [Pseudoduganella sp. FT55W]|uniref:Sel1 repeat family protein n=1 Tax=Duganella rivi TaxID=2666083 RepID=A0A7X4GR65_9BURK|nr:sel1 repeat family protein [Duganella rivi]MYM67157.1 hypothetical protein [Duganella rivi]